MVAVLTPLPLQFPNLCLESFYFSLQLMHQPMQRADQIILLGNTHSFKVGKLIPAHCAYKAYSLHNQRRVLFQTWTSTLGEKFIAQCGLGSTCLTGRERLSSYNNP